MSAKSPRQASFRRLNPSDLEGALGGVGSRIFAEYILGNDSPRRAPEPFVIVERSLPEDVLFLTEVDPVLVDHTEGWTEERPSAPWSSVPVTEIYGPNGMVTVEGDPEDLPWGVIDQLV